MDPKLYIREVATCISDEATIRMLLGFASIDAINLNLSGKTLPTWYSVMEEAARQNKLRELIKILEEQYPNKLTLNESDFLELQKLLSNSPSLPPYKKIKYFTLIEESIELYSIKELFSKDLLYFSSEDLICLNNIEAQLLKNPFAIISGSSGSGKSSVGYYLAKIFGKQDFQSYYIKINSNTDISIYTDIDNNLTNKYLFIIDDIQENLQICNKLVYLFLAQSGVSCKLILILRDISDDIKQSTFLGYNLFEKSKVFNIPTISDSKIIGILNLFKYKNEIDYQTKLEIGDIDKILNLVNKNLITTSYLLKVWLKDFSIALSDINLNELYKFLYTHFIARYDNEKIDCLLRILALYSHNIEFIQNNVCENSFDKFQLDGLIYNKNRIFQFEHSRFSELLLNAYKSVKNIERVDYEITLIIDYVNSINFNSSHEALFAIDVARLLYNLTLHNNSAKILIDVIGAAEKIKLSDENLLDAHYLLALNYRRVFNIDAALSNYETSLELVYNLLDFPLEDVLSDDFEFKLNFNNYDDDVKLNLIVISAFIMNYGIALEKSREINKAYKFYIRANFILENLSLHIQALAEKFESIYNDIYFIQVNLNNCIGRYFEIIHDYNNAIYYYNLGFYLAKKNEIYAPIVYLILNNIGKVYNDLNKFENAVSILNESIKGYEQFPEEYDASKPHYNITISYLHLKSIKRAKYHIRVAYNLMKKFDIDPSNPEFKLIIDLKRRIDKIVNH